MKLGVIYAYVFIGTASLLLIMKSVGADVTTETFFIVMVGAAICQSLSALERSDDV